MINIHTDNYPTTLRTDTFELHYFKDLYPENPVPELSTECVPLHHHDFYEVYFFLSGNLKYHIENQIYDLIPGDIILIAPHELHQPVFQPKAKYYERYVLWINPEYIKTLGVNGEDLSSCFNTFPNYGVNLLRPTPVEGAKLKDILVSLTHLSNASTSYFHTVRKALLSLILFKIKEEQIKIDYHPTDDSLSLNTLTNVLQYINTNLQKKLSISQICENCYISKSQLYREFQNTLGTSVHKYILQKRLIAAKQYLREDNSPTVTSTLSGFKDYSSFYRAFKKEYGITPTEYCTCEIFKH